MNRYTVLITFKVPGLWYESTQIPPIKESFKTLREAKKYKSIVDDSVFMAYVTDNITGFVVEEWKGKVNRNEKTD